MEDLAHITDTRLRIERLSLYGFHGALEEERRTGGLFEIDLVADLDFRGATVSEKVDDTADYTRLIRLIGEVNQSRRFRLVEAFARAIGERILAEFPQIQSVEVIVRKVTPRLPQSVRSISVSLRVTRE
ncbi:MAG: dihydroneopterin aldolase [bacterium JZ-2024 1]